MRDAFRQRRSSHVLANRRFLLRTTYCSMVKRGSKMMLDAQKATTAAVQKMGPEMVTVCSIGLDTCVLGEKDVKQGALDWFFGGTGY